MGWFETGLNVFKGGRWIGACVSASLAVTVLATETEHVGLRLLPAPEGIAVDGCFDEWNLAGGIFICGEVETQREEMACWFHAAYDDENLYILARWIDRTPLGNPGSTAGDHGWNGDCLQVRVIVHEGDDARDMPAHITAWRGSDKLDVIDITYFGGKLERPQLRDAKEHGARQAFRVLDDGSGYIQELSIPWALLAEGAFTPVAGERITMTVEPNFNTPAGDRMTIKDLFRPGETVDRIFTFMTRRCWGFATFEATADVEPMPVRLSDRRTFPVSMEDGLPVIDWSGLSAASRVEAVTSVPLELPSGGYVSLNLFDAEGRVVRQLLTAEPLTAGRHEIPWDGLTTPSHDRPGEALPAGAYRWEAIQHGGIGLELVGWAHHGGRSPFGSVGGGWGGDQGHPAAVVAAGDRVFLGWSGSESGRAVVAVDLNGGVIWRHKRGGFGNAHQLALDDGVLFVNDRQQGENVIYRLRAQDGVYVPWRERADAALDVTPLLALHAPEDDKQHRITGMDAANGRLYVAYGRGNVVLGLDAATGALLATAEIPAPAALEVGPDGAVYVVSEARTVIRFDAALSVRKPVLKGLSDAAGIALDGEGRLYVGIGGAINQVHVFAPDGALLRRIGRPGGRPLYGRWQRDGMAFIHALRIATDGRLWVMEYDDMPRRISVWNAASGAFDREFFGPTHYGAVGGAISPLDPLVMIGQGAEWRLDPQTGRATCIAVFHRRGIVGGPSGAAVNTARFGLGPDGNRLYAAVAGGWHGLSPVWIYERLAEGEWKLRTKMSAEVTGPNYALRATHLIVWADANDDGLEQPEEVRRYEVDLGGWINGWYMPMTQSMTFYGSLLRLAPVEWTACGAPVYDPTRSKRMPAPEDARDRGGMGAQRGHGSQDGRLMLYNGHYGQEHSDFVCYDIETGRRLWSYPNTFVGVHGGHKAPPPARGLIRAAYDIVGSVPLPPPIGHIFAIASDKGEWHVLTERGFYLTHLFQGNPLLRRWPPEPAMPGMRVDDVPPGGGAEDFGGAITLTTDGALHVQAGQNAFVNFKVVGLDTIREAGQGNVNLTDDQQRQAEAVRGRLLQAVSDVMTASIPSGRVVFSGDPEKDFGSEPVVRFGKPGARVSVFAAYDPTHLFLGWDVEDSTPWRNAATESAVLYTYGDTVDFQLGTDPDADPDRREAVAGDLRLSIGNLAGKPTAVLYRRVSAVRQPRTFFSGVARDGYVMEYVGVVEAANIKVTVQADKGRYVVQAALPLDALGFAPQSGLAFAGDFGVTFSNDAGDDTDMRLHWSNQATGIVADEVYELMMEPCNWGEIRFE